MGKVVSGVTDALGLTDTRGTIDAANAAAAAQRDAARMGAQASAFRPVGITSRFGTSAFDVTDVGGIPRVTGARYTVSPELTAIQDRLMGLTGGALTDAEAARMAAMPLGTSTQGLFNLGQQYLAESPEAVRQRFINQQTALLDPIRQREENRLASSVFGRGRAGLNVGDIGQPELYSLAQARREQDLQLAAQADQAAQQQIQFGSGLFGLGAQQLAQMYGIQTQALGPLQSYLGTAQTVEELGQQPFNLGLAVGGAAQPGATAGANLLTSGLTQAAQTQFAGQQAASNQMSSLLGGLLSAGANIYGMSRMGTGSVFGPGRSTMTLGGGG
jgi:hypothetical protein